VAGQCVYVFPTKRGVGAIDPERHRLAPAYTGNIKTAEGYLVPPKDIPLCRDISLPPRVMKDVDFRSTDTVSEKGRKAVRVVQWLLRTGQFPLWAEPGIIEDYEMQVSGFDILVRMSTRIQVKCDWFAGDGPGCTGNLYLQVRECNPFCQY